MTCSPSSPASEPASEDLPPEADDLLELLPAGLGRAPLEGLDELLARTRQQLLDRVWGWDHYGVDRVVDVHIGNIRKAIGDDATAPRFIATVRGVGYKFIGESR